MQLIKHKLTKQYQAENGFSSGIHSKGKSEHKAITDKSIYKWSCVTREKAAKLYTFQSFTGHQTHSFTVTVAYK